MYTCLMQGLTILEFFFTMPPYCIILCTYYKHGVDRNNDHNTDHNIHWMFCIYMNNICIMLHLWDHVSWFVCVLFLSGLHPCIPRRTWSQEWGRFNGLYCCRQSLKKNLSHQGPWCLLGTMDPFWEFCGKPLKQLQLQSVKHLVSCSRRPTPYGNQTDYRIYELNKRLQNWTEVRDPRNWLREKYKPNQNKVLQQSAVLHFAAYLLLPCFHNLPPSCCLFVANYARDFEEINPETSPTQFTFRL